MGYSSWTPEFRQDIINRMANGESPRQIAIDLGVSRSDVKNLYDNSKDKIIAQQQAIQVENKQILDSIIENQQIIQYKDEYLMPLWRGFLKQNDICSMKHAYSSPNHTYFINMGAPTWAKEIVKERFLAQTSFNLLDDTDKTAIGMVVKDIRNFGKQCNK